jgi:hypothetical protein
MSLLVHKRIRVKTIKLRVHNLLLLESISLDHLRFIFKCDDEDFRKLADDKLEMDCVQNIEHTVLFFSK